MTTPILVQGGKLSPEGRKVARHMSVLYDQVKNGMENVVQDARRNFMVLVHKTPTMSAAEYLTAYPSDWPELWHSYLLSLPEDDPERLLFNRPTEPMVASASPVTDLENTLAETKKARNRVVALIEASMNPLSKAHSAPLAESVQQIAKLQANTPLTEGRGRYARLTPHGDSITHILTEALSKGVAIETNETDYVTALETFVAYTRPRKNEQPLMTCAEFYADFPTMARRLTECAYAYLTAQADSIERGLREVKRSTPSSRIVTL